jgi:hypothetical protein
LYLLLIRPSADRKIMAPCRRTGAAARAVMMVAATGLRPGEVTGLTSRRDMPLAGQELDP